MHEEYYEISEDVAERINEAKRLGKRVIAVGTTSCRVLESAAVEKGLVKAQKDGQISSSTQVMSLKF